MHPPAGTPTNKQVAEQIMRSREEWRVLRECTAHSAKTGLTQIAPQELREVKGFPLNRLHPPGPLGIFITPHAHGQENMPLPVHTAETRLWN